MTVARLRLRLLASPVLPSLAALGILAGCESTRIAPGAHQPGLALANDEQQLWHRVEEESDALEHSGFVAAWPEVDAYLDGVAARLHSGPIPTGTQVRVRVLVDPTLNAFAMPNGAVYLHTGLLARLENEAQLAAVLSHELTHATHRHALRSYRNVKNQSALLATLTVGTGGIAGLLGSFGALASVSGYSRELEREADAVGFQRMLAAGYDPSEAPKVFRTLLAESRRSKLKEPFFFGSHPRLTERIASFEQLVAAQPATAGARHLGREAYTAILPRVLVANAEAALRAGDFEFARQCAESGLALQPDAPEAPFQLAEVDRKRGDVAPALTRYRELTARHPAFAPAFRGLGLMLLKTGDHAAATAAFQRYLALRPDAEDRAHIESFIRQCQNPS